MIGLWLLFGLVNAGYVRVSVGPIRVSRWIACIALGPIPPAIAFFDYLSSNNIFNKRI
jgi:hypothetical protein